MRKGASRRFSPEVRIETKDSSRPSHVGAHGYCVTCGNTIILEESDSPPSWDKATGLFFMNCPICKQFGRTKEGIFFDPAPSQTAV